MENKIFLRINEGVRFLNSDLSIELLVKAISGKDGKRNVTLDIIEDSLHTESRLSHGSGYLGISESPKIRAKIDGIKSFKGAKVPIDIEYENSLTLEKIRYDPFTRETETLPFVSQGMYFNHF